MLAFGFSGKDDLQSLASRAHPVFGIVFTTVLYLAIGPLFAIPRTGNVSYEIGLKPFMPEGVGSTPLILFTIIFFSITCFFHNPAKIVDIVGKILTPIVDFHRYFSNRCFYTSDWRYASTSGSLYITCIL